jgi:hypothetical protein
MVSSILDQVLAVIAEVRYLVVSVLDLIWAFIKLPKSIPEALKKDLGAWLD